MDDKVPQLIERLEREIENPSNYDFELMGYKVLSGVDRSRGNALGAKLRHGLSLSAEELAAGRRILSVGHQGDVVKPNLVERFLDRKITRQNREIDELLKTLADYAARPSLEPLESAAAPAASQADAGHDISR